MSKMDHVTLSMSVKKGSYDCSCSIVKQLTLSNSSVPRVRNFEGIHVFLTLNPLRNPVVCLYE